MKTAGSTLLSAELAMLVCTHPAGLGLALVQTERTAGEHKFISKNPGSMSYPVPTGMSMSSFNLDLKLIKCDFYHAKAKYLMVRFVIFAAVRKR